ncbi:MAG: hypothetical protein IT537_01175, partial [Hyphomicrobiales bacterium]|nr:hypothetical protein [Hyphomicrobiales bacterium]
MSLGLLPKAERLLAATAGLAIGWYRVRAAGPHEARNPNAHYIIDAARVRARIDEAIDKPLFAGAYPIIYWLTALLRDKSEPHICDFGGAYGEAFFRFRRYIPNLRYTVVEIPEIVRSARLITELASVEFTEAAPLKCDVLFSSGVIMNAHEAVFDAIDKIKPPALIISSVEVTDEPTYWSTVVMRKHGRRCPYVTFNRSEFIKT